MRKRALGRVLAGMIIMLMVVFVVGMFAGPALAQQASPCGSTSVSNSIGGGEATIVGKPGGGFTAHPGVSPPLGGGAQLMAIDSGGGIGSAVSKGALFQGLDPGGTAATALATTLSATANCATATGLNTNPVYDPGRLTPTTTLWAMAVFLAAALMWRNKNKLASMAEKLHATKTTAFAAAPS